MSKLIQIDRVLCLPKPEILALQEGRVIAALPQVSIQKGWNFGLYPYDTINNSPPCVIDFWAKCEHCTILHQAEQLENLVHSTVWTKIELQDFLQQRQHIFLTYLRVYRLAQPLSIKEEPFSTNKFGRFLGLPALCSSETTLPIKVNEVLPILSDAAFIQRQQWLESGKPSPHPELEELSSQLAQLADPNAQKFQRDIKVFLGYVNYYEDTLETNLDWIKTIDALGRRSLEEDGKGKSNWQAGTDFENVVRQSLEFLGFKVDEAYKGGSGGLDLYCSQPYPLTGECKAGKGIPPATTEELIRLGGRHLSPDEFIHSAKLVIGPGKPPTQVLETAKQWKVSIISPMSLQKLVEFQAKYPNAINLFELKEYLVAGQIDSKIDEYINKVWQQIKVRSNIVQAVKQLNEMEPDQTQFEVKEIRVQYKNKLADQNDNLDNQTVYEILLELSSPLAGYIGRVSATGIDSDRFYFLRELRVD